MENNTEKNRPTGGTYIDGRKQAYEILSMLTAEERNRIIRQVRLKSPQIAQDLLMNSLTFENIKNVSDDDLSEGLTSIASEIIGLALKKEDPELQRRILSLIPREKAVKAFEVMNSQLRLKMDDLQRAKKRVILTLMNAGKITL